jgi:hypothetical protein
MIKKILVFLLLSTPAYAVDTQSNINAADAYWQKKADHTSTSTVDSYMGSHRTQNTTSASQEAGQLGAGARQNYSNASGLGAMLNNHQAGNGGVVDLAGLPSNNYKTTTYDLCLFNNPGKPELCANDKATSDAYKQCKTYNPTTWQTTCAGMAGALAKVDYKSGCSNSKEYIKLAYLPDTSTFDISTLALFVDPALNGVKTYLSPLPAPASGICANGIITCNAGTFSNCKYYKWIDTGGGMPGFALTNNMSELGGCYCVNKSCGSNLPLLNSAQILRDLSAGASSAILKSVGEGAQITDTQPEYGILTITVNAAKLSDCAGTAAGSKPSVTTSDPKVSNLTGIAQRMTNENPTTDFLEEAGASAKAAMENNQDPQGADISTEGFADPATRAQWKSSYQANGNNYYKTMRNINDITTSGYQDVSCAIKRNYVISNPIYQVPGSGQTWVSTDHLSTQTLTKSGNSYSLIFWGSKIGNQTLTSWTVSPPTGTTNSTTTTPTGGSTTQTTTTTNSSTVLGTIESFAINVNADCNGSVSFNKNSSFVVNYPSPCGAPDIQSFYATWNYDFKYQQDISSEGISDSCSSLDSETNCRMKDEKIDGISTSVNYMQTGLVPLPACKTFSGQVNPSYTACRPWWEKKRTYSCLNPPNSNTDIDNIVKRADSINQTTTYNSATGDITFTDNAKDKNGNWGTSQQSDNLKVSVKSPGNCDMVCKVSFLQTDTQVRIENGSTINTPNPNDPQRTGVNVLPATGGTGTTSGQKSAVKAYKYLYCNVNNPANITANSADWSCPVASDETVEVPCSCPNNFGKSVGKVTALIEAGKNMKCSKGTIVTAP